MTQDRPPEAVTPELDDELDEIEAALESLRLEIRERFTPQRREFPLPHLDWQGLYTDLRRRLGTLGMREHSGEVDDFGLEEAAVRSARPLLELLFDRWWRVDLSGVEGLPEKGPCLMVANRSGLLPYDGLMLSHAVHRFHPAAPLPRFLVADWLMTLPFVQPTLSRVGGVRACRENADRLLRTGRWVVAFPEGAQGAAKVFRERYRLKRFGRGGVVRAALENRVPLVPVGVVGAEEAHPVLFKAHAPARAIGLPFLPVTPTFPLLGPLGLLPLPTKWVIRVGEPIALDHLEPDAADDELLISRLTEELRARIQTLVDTALADRQSIWS